MDYPSDNPDANLLAGKFTDGDPVGGVPASGILAQWMNGVTDELRNIIAAASLAPDDATHNQVLQALGILFVGVAQQGQFASSLVKTGNYGIQTADFGRMVVLGAAAAGGATFGVPDGTSGSTVGLYNDSTFDLAVGEGAGASTPFRWGNYTTTSFTLRPGKSCLLVRGDGIWLIFGLNMADSQTLTANYTATPQDFDSQLLWGSTATSNGTISIPDGRAPGDRIRLGNRTNLYTLTIQMAGGTTGAFGGCGYVTASSFTIPNDGDAEIVWTGVFWHLRYLSRIITSSGFSGTSGYVIHADGLIEQWGTGTLSGGTATVTWPIAFPNGVYSASFIANTTSGSTSSAGPTFSQPSSTTTTQGTVWGAPGSSNPFVYRVRGR